MPKYTKTQWVNDVTKLNADNLNKIEKGIETATDEATSANSLANEAKLLANEALQKIVQTQDSIPTKLSELEIDKELGVNEDTVINLIANYMNTNYENGDEGSY